MSTHVDMVHAILEHGSGNDYCLTLCEICLNSHAYSISLTSYSSNVLWLTQHQRTLTQNASQYRWNWQIQHTGTPWHDNVIKWKHFPRYWPFVRGIHRSSVNSPDKGQWRGALMFSLICAWINGWVYNREAGDIRRHRAHYDVIVMKSHDSLYLALMGDLWGAFCRCFRENYRT